MASEPDPLRAALRRVGDRWTLLVIDALLQGPLRFGELAEQVEGIAPNILTNRLRSLERDGLVVARPYQERPLRHAYALSEEGRALGGALRVLAQWGAMEGGGEPLRHDACGTPAEVRWYCPTCARLLDDDETGAHVRL